MALFHSFANRAFTRLLTSTALRNATRQRHALLRKLRGATAQVHYFHQPDDPYSHLAALQLEALGKRYRIALVAHLVPPPDAAAAPDAERLRAWSARDAQRLAAHHGLQVPDFAEPFASLHTDPSSALSHALGEADRKALAHTGSHAALLARGAKLRAQWGHYLGATFYWEGEWYWGIDRLHYLEQRLMDAGLSRGGNAAIARSAPLRPLVPVPSLQNGAPLTSTPASAPVLHFYCSLRSPYTYLAAMQVQQLAERYGAVLQIRFVLPMVMRGLPVPLAKRLYIIRDAKREAQRLGLPFGDIVDPVGPPTERGLALLHRAIAMGKGMEMLQSFLQGVFAQGIDAASPKGLQRMAQRAGLGAQDVRDALADPSWRAVAEANRAELAAQGLWGVPAFRVDGQPALWGQDRLWMVEQDLRRTGAC